MVIFSTLLVLATRSIVVSVFSVAMTTGSGRPLQEGDPQSTGVISFVNLIKLLSKHQLYISESGNIARYGKTKGTQGGDLTRGERVVRGATELFLGSASTLVWLAVYLLLNAFVFGVGIALSSGDGVRRIAYGVGPVLSMSTVLVLLPTLLSVITALRGSEWMNKVLTFIIRNRFSYVFCHCFYSCTLRINHVQYVYNYCTSASPEALSCQTSSAWLI